MSVTVASIRTSVWPDMIASSIGRNTTKKLCNAVASCNIVMMLTMEENYRKRRFSRYLTILMASEWFFEANREKRFVLLSTFNLFFV